MISEKKRYYRLLGIFSLGLLALSIPLLRDFHLESAMLAALFGCFWAAWKSCTVKSIDSDWNEALQVLGYLYLLGLPLLVYALFTGCFSMHGLGFWLIYPIPSVFFGYSIGRLCRKLTIPFRQSVAVMLLLFIALGVLIVEFYTLPQVYFLNHVWGGWPGPIYDETVKITGSLIAYRSITIIWAVLFWFVGDLKSPGKAKWITLTSVLLLLLSYSQLSELGIISPGSYIQKELGSVKQTKHFKLYYPQAFYTEDEINQIALEHEFYLAEITKKLAIEKPDGSRKIESYLYAHPWQKKKLVGAKFTSYVPVWLDQDQLHIAKQQIAGSLKHELVHVLAKQFGNKLLNASWSIGLIEGLAVALSADESRTSTIDQLVVSEKPLPNAEDMRHALSPIGFYGGRSAVNYTTSGSFVSYLLDNYPVDQFKRAYQTGSISRAYAESFEALTEGWHQHLDSVKADSVDRGIAQRLFSIHSLFEKDCPHILSDFAEEWDNYRFYLAEGDTSEAVTTLDVAYQLKSEHPLIKSEWTYMNLIRGNFEKVLSEASLQDSTVDLQLLYADAFMLSGDSTRAVAHLDKGRNLVSAYSDTAAKIALETRLDPMQWKSYRRLTYDHVLFEEVEFGPLLYRTKIRAIEKAIAKEQWEKVQMYAEILSMSDLDVRYFDTYVTVLHTLGYLGKWKQANAWLNKIAQIDLRTRYIERLEQQRNWVIYLQNRKPESR